MSSPRDDDLKIIADQILHMNRARIDHEYQISQLKHQTNHINETMMNNLAKFMPKLNIPNEPKIKKEEQSTEPKIKKEEQSTEPTIKKEEQSTEPTIKKEEQS
jgi:ABC-type uncharacterized transport system ATPase subunit